MIKSLMAMEGGWHEGLLLCGHTSIVIFSANTLHLKSNVGDDNEDECFHTRKTPTTTT
jgi:hypothetical protein